MGLWGRSTVASLNALDVGEEKHSLRFYTWAPRAKCAQVAADTCYNVKSAESREFRGSVKLAEAVTGCVTEDSNEICEYEIARTTVQFYQLPDRQGAAIELNHFEYLKCVAAS